MKHKMNPVLDAQLNRRRGYRGHKRNLSDPRFSTSLSDDYYSGVEDEVSQAGEPTNPRPLGPSFLSERKLVLPFKFATWH